jgi:hypothetical protein
LCLRILGTFLFGSLMLVSAVMLGDKALTPIPPDRAPVLDSKTALRLRTLEHTVGEQQLTIAEQQKLICDLKCQQEQRMRDEARRADLIPAQQVPTVPVPLVRIPTPEEVEVRP